MKNVSKGFFKYIGLVIACLMISSFGSVVAQVTNTPALHTYIEENIDVPFFRLAGSLRSQYAEIYPAYDEVETVTDVPYGEHELQTLDIYYPSGADNASLPVVLYVHGGGFTGGDKRAASNIPQYFASKGFVGVSMNFVLSPESVWPGAEQDIATAIEWLALNIGSYGGNADKTTLVGHSSGASVAAGYLFGMASHADLALTSGILLSGPYAAGSFPPSAEYYGEDQSLWDSRSPLVLARSQGQVPIMLAEAEYDSTGTQIQTSKLREALCERDRSCPPTITVLGHNHLSEIYHIGSADEILGSYMRNFIQLNLGE